jgi:hypothetical protein
LAVAWIATNKTINWVFIAPQCTLSVSQRLRLHNKSLSIEFQTA